MGFLETLAPEALALIEKKFLKALFVMLLNCL
jgi:hypothetical protein